MDDDADKEDDGDQTPMKAKRKCPGVSSESHISLAKKASQYSNVLKKLTVLLMLQVCVVDEDCCSFTRDSENSTGDTSLLNLRHMIDLWHQLL